MTARASARRVNLIGLGALVAGLLSILSTGAAEARRVALVIGNSGYQNVSTLTNPANDAAAIAETLRAIGFDAVEEARDLDQTAFRKALRTFTSAAAGAETALIYYAGHGVEVDGRNFLVPVDAILSEATDTEFEAIPLESLRTAVSGASNLRLVILDACRNNPFKLESADGTRSIGRGLARVEPGANEVVAYAAREGTVAADGEGGNSPYATSLIKHLKRPGLDVRLMFGEVRDEVMQATGKKQEPFIYATLGGKPVTLSDAPAETAPADAPAAAADTAPAETGQSPNEKRAADAWITVKDTTSVAILKAYIAKFEGTVFADLAAARLAEIEGGAAPSTAEPTPPESEVAAAEPVANAAAAPETEEIEPVTIEPVIRPVGKWAEGAALVGSTLWVAESGQRSLVALDLKGKTVAHPKVGRLPVAVEASDDGFVYSVQNTDKTLWVKAPKESKGGIIADLGECPQDLAVSENAAWVLSWPDCSSANARVIRVDKRNGRLRQSDLLGEWGETVTVAHGRIWVGHVRGGKISIVDPETLVASPLDIGDMAVWDITGNGQSVVAGGRVGEDNARGLVMTIDPQTGQGVSTRELSQMVQRVAADDEHVVAASLDGTLTVMDAGTLIIQRIITLTTGPFRPSDLIISGDQLIVVAQQLGGENGAVLVVNGWRPAPVAGTGD